LVKRGALESRFDPNFYRKYFRILTESIKRKPHSRLGEMVSFSNESWNQSDFFEDKFPYIEISEIDVVSGEIKNISKIAIDEAPSRAKMIVRKNDIIVSTTRPSRGAIAFIDKKTDFSIASTGFSVIRRLKTDKIDRQFLFYVLRQNFSLFQMEQRSSGGNYPAITQEELSNLYIPVPPLEIQAQIVKKFNEAYETKRQKEAEAKALLASIDGYLLEKLGIVLPEKVETKPVFLTRFKDLRGKRFDPFYHKAEFEVANKSVLKGKYEIKNIGQIIQKLIKGRLPKDSEKDGDCQVVQINSIRKDGSIDLENLLTSKPIFTDDQKLLKHDVLIVITGATIGKVGFWQYEGEYFLGGDVVKFQCKEDMNSQFVYSYLRCAIIQTELKRYITGATNGHLSPSDVKQIQIPLPPLEIQTEIANHISQIRVQAKTLETEAKTILTQAKAQAERLILGNVPLF
jgi:restriction endonuclease S subunit